MSYRITPLTDPDPGPYSRRPAWLASGTGGFPLGCAYVTLFDDAGRKHLAELALHVHPAERRSGVGTQLLAPALDAARADGRRVVLAQVDAGSAGDAFLPARGFRRVLALTYTRLALADADLGVLSAEVARPHPGYRLVRWHGTVPDDLAASFAASRRAMDDMPMDDADVGTMVWDTDRVRDAARKVADRGDLLHTVAAVADGSVVGFTELVVPGDGRGDAQHYGTAVLPEHRGRGLARWMKAASIVRARADHPALAGLLTDTADSNRPMRAVNDALGYLPTHRTHQYQADL